MKSHDWNKPLACIIYLGKKNLYEWAMIQHPPTGGFKWPMHDEISKYNPSAIQEDIEEGYTY